LDESHSNMVTNSTCYDNLDFGIYLSISDSNNITWSIFFDNGANAYDDGLDNTFDYNYWSDYIGADTNEDGVGDTPYTFSGNQDPHPLMAPPGSPPFWLQSPTDQVSEFGESIYYDLNASVYGGIAQWWINDTMHFAIDISGIIVNITALPVGSFGIHVWANDTLGNTLDTTFTVVVEDTTAPEWTQTPTYQIVEYGEYLSYDLNFTDLSEIDTCWINDTARFSIDSTGQVLSIVVLDVGTYGFEIYISDIHGNILMASIIIEVIDTTPPELLVSVTDQYLEYGETLEYQLSAYDLSGIGQWSLNDTTNFEIDSLGLITSVGHLDAGKYGLNVTVADPYGNELSVVFTVQVSSEITTTTTTTTSVTDTGPPLGAILITAAVGSGIAVVIVIVFLRRRSSKE